MAINMDMKVTNMQTLETATIADMYAELINEMISGGVFSEITEEEFYNLE
jgi:hypothetical protein